LAFAMREFAARGFASVVLEIFNRFEAPLCDAGVAADLRDLPAAGLGDFAAFDVVRAAGFAPAGRRVAGLEDFLRDFWDIRLPFVAFGGSIMRPLQVLSGEPESSHQLGKSETGQVWRRWSMVTRISIRLFARRKSC
jgi:hypothetical protein